MTKAACDLSRAVGPEPLWTTTGPSRDACYPRHTHEEFLAFLNALVRAFPRKPLHVVLDNSSTHSTPEVKRWLERHKRVHFHFTPTGAPLRSERPSAYRR